MRTGRLGLALWPSASLTFTVTRVVTRAIRLRARPLRAFALSRTVSFFVPAFPSRNDAVATVRFFPSPILRAVAGWTVMPTVPLHALSHVTVTVARPFLPVFVNLTFGAALGGAGVTVGVRVAVTAGGGPATVTASAAVSVWPSLSCTRIAGWTTRALGYVNVCWGVVVPVTSNEPSPSRSKS